eukprot:TRINITY_DN2314_c0_g1_i1.p1 TRINITY_DN2314_c0_g1~~TRINITY_DN2314_c0_g1_i1.p1  ORF type:complete len:181 (-),score=28.64 TRINITY_DN2314_c0_g1_i1:468-1010(-)
MESHGGVEKKHDVATTTLSSSSWTTGCPVVIGLWQTAGAHGPIDPDAAVRDLQAYVAEGFVAFDGADIYGPAEALLGALKKKTSAPVELYTKWVPRPGPMTKSIASKAIKRSLSRLNVSCIDLLQFHWWDYEDKRYLEAMQQLAMLQKKGKIKHLAVRSLSPLFLFCLFLPLFVSYQLQY